MPELQGMIYKREEKGCPQLSEEFTRADALGNTSGRADGIQRDDIFLLFSVGMEVQARRSVEFWRLGLGLPKNICMYFYCSWEPVWQR